MFAALRCDHLGADLSLRVVVDVGLAGSGDVDADRRCCLLSADLGSMGGLAADAGSCGVLGVALCRCGPAHL